MNRLDFFKRIVGGVAAAVVAKSVDDHVFGGKNTILNANPMPNAGFKHMLPGTEVRFAEWSERKPHIDEDGYFHSVQADADPDKIVYLDGKTLAAAVKPSVNFDVGASKEVPIEERRNKDGHLDPDAEPRWTQEFHIPIKVEMTDRLRMGTNKDVDLG